jgi:hypothetical protein
MKIIFFMSEKAESFTICSLCNDIELVDGLKDWRNRYGPEVSFFALDCPDKGMTIGELFSDDGELIVDEAVKRVGDALDRAQRGENVPELISLDEMEYPRFDASLN